MDASVSAVEGSLGMTSDMNVRPSLSSVDAGARKMPDAVQMFPPEQARVLEPLGSRLWANADALSTQLREVYEGVLSGVGAPSELPPSTGNYVLDLQNALSAFGSRHGEMLHMQLRLSESGNLVNISVAMAQSAQHSARTLLQDK